MQQRLVEIRPSWFAHASGALWLAEPRIAVIADAHLGYGWAQRRRGQLGPVGDGGAKEKFSATIRELGAEAVVLLGDIVHAPSPGVKERALVEETLRSIAEQARVIAVRGNHDRGFAKDYAGLGIEVLEYWKSDGLIGIHGDRVPDGLDAYVLTGHLHPAVGVRDDAGHSQRIPVFLISERAMVLPAFSPFAAGLDVKHSMPKETRALLGRREIVLIAVSGTRSMRIGTLDQLRKTYAADPRSAISRSRFIRRKTDKA